MAKKTSEKVANEAEILDAYLASAPPPGEDLLVVRPKAYRMSADDASLNPERFKGTPGDLAITARYSGKMTAMRLADWQGDPAVGIEYTYEGGPKPVVVRFGIGAGSVGISAEKQAARAKRAQAFDPTVKVKE